MIEVTGDIWEFHHRGWRIVIPTNVGWRKDGTNVMGRGLARQAADLYPDLPKSYGVACMEMASDASTWLDSFLSLILFPVKPLNTRAYHLSWQGPADPTLINRSAGQLATWERGKHIALPLVGCGNGGLDEAEVLPILRYHLSDDRFTLVRMKP